MTSYSGQEASSPNEKDAFLRSFHEKGGPVTTFSEAPGGKRDDSLSSEDTEKPEARSTWAHKAEYLLSMVGYCVGLGNVWRFPYICVRNGGGAFLIPFFICLFVCGLPLYFLEVAVGQFVSKSPYHIWAMCPMFRGVGVAQIVLLIFSNWYYIMVLTWTVIFLVNSFKSPLPWTLCGQSWNTPGCVPQSGFVARHLMNGSNTNINLMNDTISSSANNSMFDGSLYNSSGEGLPLSVVANGSSLGDGFDLLVNNTQANATVRSASEEFWINHVLELSPGLEYMDGVPWHTALALAVCSLVVYLCLWKGIKTVGKVVYVTATLPYLIITVLLIRGATLPGAADGLLFYITPDFSKLLRVTTWIEACVQVFYSLGPAWGNLITMASYNKFKNNCQRDSVILSLICEGTSIYTGLATFCFLGHMSYKLNVPVGNFSTSGAGLAFVVYPEAISYLPLPQLWGVLFFVMLLSVGLDTQFVGVESVLTFISDLWPKFIKRWNLAVKTVLLSTLFLFSLVFCSRGGPYIFQLVDWYIGAFTVMFTAILECIAVAWIYGTERISKDIELMTGRRPMLLFLVLWKYVVPVLLTAVCGATLAFYTAPVYEGYTYGPAGVGFGWFIALASFVPIPVCAIHMLLTKKGTLIQRLRAACTPTDNWKPSDESLQEIYRFENKNHQVFDFSMPCGRKGT